MATHFEKKNRYFEKKIQSKMKLGPINPFWKKKFQVRYEGSSIYLLSKSQILGFDFLLLDIFMICEHLWI